MPVLLVVFCSLYSRIPHISRFEISSSWLASVAAQDRFSSDLVGNPEDGFPLRGSYYHMK